MSSEYLRRKRLTGIITSTTVWDKAAKKRRKVSEYLGKITPRGLEEKKDWRHDVRTVFEYGNTRALWHLAGEIMPSLRKWFPRINRLLQILREHELNGRISVNELLFELSKVYMVHYQDGTRGLSEIPARAEKLGQLFNFDLFPKNCEVTVFKINLFSLYLM